jgi:hypothetical protein
MPNHWLSALCPVHQAPSLSLRVLWRSLGRFCRYNILKDLADAAMQSLSRTALERGQNFARTSAPSKSLVSLAGCKFLLSKA